MIPVVKIKFGSHLYGTNTETSDLDYKSIHLPPSDEILLQRVSNSVSNAKRTKAEGEKNSPEDVDEESYSLQRFLQLASEGQTVALDMLFAPEANQEYTSDLWKYIQENRGRLLTKKSVAFVGYCRQQANKYGIKGSRVSAAKSAAEFFADVRDYQNKVKDIDLSPLVRSNPDHISLIEQQINSDGDTGWFIEVCNRKVSFDATAKQAYEVFSKIYQNYGDRARKAESNEGIDWKALSHAVRVGTQALELLQHNTMTFPLPNREEVLAIKQGKLPYAQVSERIECLLEQVEQAALNSDLPDKADYRWIDETVKNNYLEVIHFSEDFSKYLHSV